MKIIFFAQNELLLDKLREKSSVMFSDECDGGISLAFKLMSGRQIKYSFSPDAIVKVW